MQNPQQYNSQMNNTKHTNNIQNRYRVSFQDMGGSAVDSLWTLLEKPENKAKATALIDPIIQHVIKSVFPYIALSAVLFVILLIVAVLTFIIVLRASQGPGPLKTVVAAAAATTMFEAVSSLAAITTQPDIQFTA